MTVLADNDGRGVGVNDTSHFCFFRFTAVFNDSTSKAAPKPCPFQISNRSRRIVECSMYEHSHAKDQQVHISYGDRRLSTSEQSKGDPDNEPPKVRHFFLAFVARLRQHT